MLCLISSNHIFPGKMNSKQKAVICDAWMDAALTAFFPQTDQTFRRNSDFSNPVGQAFHSGMSEIIANLSENASLEKYYGPLDRIIRVLAVQGLPAGTAVRLLFLLKNNLHTVPGLEIKERHCLARTIDRLAELAADIWSDCREKLLQIQIEQLRRHIRLQEAVSSANEKGGTD